MILPHAWIEPLDDFLAKNLLNSSDYDARLTDEETNSDDTNFILDYLLEVREATKEISIPLYYKFQIARKLFGVLLK